MTKKEDKREAMLGQVVPWIVASGLGILNLIAFGGVIPESASGATNPILELTRVFTIAFDAGVPLATLAVYVSDVRK